MWRIVCIGTAVLLAWPSAGQTSTQLEEWDRAGEVPLTKPPREAIMPVDGLVWLDAEDFADTGGWVVDTQFVHLLGSAYLIAPGVGEPVADGLLHVHHQAPHIDAVQRGWLALQRSLAPDLPAPRLILRWRSFMVFSCSGST